jgi:hypothetical protein
MIGFSILDLFCEKTPAEKNDRERLIAGLVRPCAPFYPRANVAASTQIFLIASGNPFSDGPVFEQEGKLLGKQRGKMISSEK